MKTDNITAAAFTRAAQIATNAIKSKFRDDGHKLRDFRISDHATAIATIAASEEILARARADVERWRKNGGRIRSREMPVKRPLPATARDRE